MFEWTLMKRLIWIKAAVISGAASLYETVTGAIVSFVALHAKALKKLVVNIEPVQDLHGYDAPWPPGGGVNQFDPSDATPVPPGRAYGLTVTVDTTAETLTASGSASWPASGGSFSFALVDVTKNYTGLVGNVFVVSKSSNVTSVNSISYSNGAIAINATVTADGTTSIVLKVSFASASQPAWTPYANECPISGWTGVKIWARGKNLLKPEFEQGSALGPSANRVRSTEIIPIEAGKNYCLSASDYSTFKYVMNTSSKAVYPFVNGEYRYCGNDGAWKTSAYSFLATHDGYLAVVVAKNGDSNLTPEDIANVNILLEVGSTSTNYEPYSGQEIDVPFPDEAGTVYGGTDEVIGGNLKKTLKGVDLSTLAWSLTSSTYGRWTAAIPDIKSPTDGATPLNGLAEKYRIVTSNAYNNIVGTMYCVPNGTTVNICNGSTTDTPSGTLVYEAAEPQQFTHEGHEISTQVGTNTIWADAGDVEVTYYAK